MCGRKRSRDSRNMSTQNNCDTSETLQKPMRKFKRNPPRKHIIQNPAELAASFAKVVTTPSDMPDDWVARNGDKSIFFALRNVLPEVSAPPQHCQRRLGCVGRVCVGPDSLSNAGLSTWHETTPDKGHNRSIGAEQDSTVSTRIQV